MAAGRIFYVAPDDNRPIGGIRAIYRHVDILNRNGFAAAVLHQQPGFRATWFEHATAVAYLPQVLIDRARDVVVYPEVRAFNALTEFPGTRKVIFNQGFFLTFPDAPFNPASPETPYRHPDVIGGLVNSEAGKAYVSHIFPAFPLHRVRLSIDPAMFQFQREKKWQIAMMPRRNSHDLIQIFNILKHRRTLHDLQPAPIEQLAQDEAAKVLRESLFFVTVGMQEGFGLPAAEAMACGCITVGYHGFGGKEFLLPAYAFPTEPGDVLATARALEACIMEYRQNPARLDIMRQEAAAFIARNCSPAEEERELLAAWRAILGR
jgi:hypothetical protein